MVNNNPAGLNDLLQLFEDSLSVADINASKYLGKISAAIVKRRTEMKMTQKEFAEYLGVSQGMVSKWEGGDYNFTIRAVAEIAEKLDMEMYVNLKKPCDVSEVTYFETCDYSGVISEKKSFVGKTGKIIHFQAKAGSVYSTKINNKIYSYSELVEM